MVAIFDAAGVSFVSVTQQFNTTTSMDRLTLNVLLSFAQFEREVTAERIRDKIAASKAKGMWMGGVPAIGYRPDNRMLVPVPEEAKIVLHVFERYLELSSVRKLQAELKRAGRVTPLRVTQKGKDLWWMHFLHRQTLPRAVEPNLCWTHKTSRQDLRGPARTYRRSRYLGQGPGDSC
jgi:DNA invertase Pin-like site-specific DNA recombinase